MLTSTHPHIALGLPCEMQPDAAKFYLNQEMKVKLSLSFLLLLLSFRPHVIF